MVGRRAGLCLAFVLGLVFWGVVSAERDVLSAIDEMEKSIDSPSAGGLGESEVEAEGEMEQESEAEGEAHSEGNGEGGVNSVPEEEEKRQPNRFKSTDGQAIRAVATKPRRTKARPTRKGSEGAFSAIRMEEMHVTAKKGKKAPPRAPRVSSVGFVHCYRENVWSSFDSAGWAKCSAPGSYLNGIYRNDANCKSISCIEELKCCLPKKVAQYGDCYDDDTVQRQWEVNKSGKVREMALLQEEEASDDSFAEIGSLPTPAPAAVAPVAPGPQQSKPASTPMKRMRLKKPSEDGPLAGGKRVRRGKDKSFGSMMTNIAALNEQTSYMKKGKKMKPSKNRGGWTQCEKPGYVMTGMHREKGDTLDHINKFRCCKPPAAENVYWRCYVENHTKSMDQKGWHRCRRAQHFLVGFWRTPRCNKLHCLELFKCCHPSYISPRPPTKTFRTAAMQTPGMRVEVGRFTFSSKTSFRMQAEHAGQFDAGLWSLDKGSSERKFFQRRINFKTPFHKSPQVSATVQAYEDADYRNHRFEIHLTRVDRAGFEFTCQTWADAVIYSVTITYSAVGQDRAALQAQEKREGIIRETVKKDGIYYKWWQKTEAVIKAAKDEAFKHHHWVKEVELPKLYKARKEIVMELQRQSALVGEYYKYVEQIKRMFYRTWLRGLIYFKVLHCIIADVKESQRKHDESQKWAVKTLKLMRARSMRAIVLLRKDMNKMWDEYKKMDTVLDYLAVKVKSKVTGLPMPFLQPLPDDIHGDSVGKDEQDRMMCECMHGADQSGVDKRMGAEMEGPSTVSMDEKMPTPTNGEDASKPILGEIDIPAPGDKDKPQKDGQGKGTADADDHSHDNLKLENSHLPPVRDVPPQPPKEEVHADLPGPEPRRKCVCKRKKGNHVDKVTLLL